MYRHIDPNKIYALDGVRLRNKISKLVYTDIEQAYKSAQSIQHPWYRCQALAMVAGNVSRTYAKAVIAESFESAKSCHDENRRVSVACWPLEVAIKLECSEIAESIVDFCSEQLGHTIDPISKWCAVSVVHAVKSDGKLLNRFYTTFVRATEKRHGWKVEKWLKDMSRDELIGRDRRYIYYVTQRLNAIQQWKRDNPSSSSS